MSKRILVVDDHDVVRQGVLWILGSHPEWQVVGEASDGIEAVQKIEQLKPDLVILDISMPRKDGLDVLADLCRMKLGSKILVLTMHDSHELGEQVKHLGASGYVTKANAGRDLMHAIQTIFEADQNVQ